MRIIIIGCGKIGTTILSSLTAEGHDVVCIDSDKKVIGEISNIYDVMCVCGTGTDCDILSEAQVDKAQLVVAVTGSDEFNMLSCYLARKMGAKHSIARIRNPEYNENSLGFLKSSLNLSMSLNPESLTAYEIFRLLRLPSAISVETFSGRSLEMIGLIIKPGSSLCNMSLIDLRKKHDAKFLICAVERDGEVVIPDGNFVLKEGDKIELTASPNEISKLLKSMSLLQKQAKSVMIIGASTTAFYLAKRLSLGGASVKIIEKDIERCKEFSNLLPGVSVIHGDGTNQDILLEEGIEEADGFVALTGMDEQNILISFFASSHNVPKVISKVNSSELAGMAEKLGLECIISPKVTISSLLTRYARALENSMGSNVESLYKILDGKAEVLEFAVKSDFEHLDIPLKDLHLKRNVLIAGIVRNSKTAIVPTGIDTIKAGDRVIVLSKGDMRLRDLSDIISG